MKLYLMFGFEEKLVIVLNLGLKLQYTGFGQYLLIILRHPNLNISGKRDICCLKNFSDILFLIFKHDYFNVLSVNEKWHLTYI